LGRIKIIIGDNMKDRYRVELSLNIWSDSDTEAVKVAQDICDEQKQKFDNRCQIIKVCSSPFGRIEGEDIVPTVYRQEIFNEQSTQ
tara:strand:+ start:171 stop:428 length:258 start_codon:yes stop_codon:yes gene_type:complete